MYKKMSLGSRIVISEFEKRDYSIELLSVDKGIYRVSKDGKFTYMLGSNASIDFALNSIFAKNKKYTNYFCKKNDITVPKQKVCSDLKQIKIAIKRIKFPVVIKPVSLSHGEGIVVNIKNIKDLLYESKIALEEYGDIIIEKYVRGKDYRLLVVDGEFVSAVYRSPAVVIGDGKNTIKKLISLENKNPLRGLDYTKPLMQIVIDEETERVLIKNGYTLNEIPDKDEIVYLKETSNQSKGGATETVTDKVHISFIKMAEKAAKAIGLKYAGVDIITPDISKNSSSVGGYVIEVNSFPGIDMHQYPSKGKGDDVGKSIVDMIEKYCFK